MTASNNEFNGSTPDSVPPAEERSNGRGSKPVEDDAMDAPWTGEENGASDPEQLDPPAEPEELRSFVEAALLVSDDPLTARRLGDLLGCDGREIRELMEGLKEEYDRGNRGFQLIKVSGGFKLTTREEHYPWLKRLFGQRTVERMSEAAMETLVIVAYHQPIIREEIQSIRGVNCQSVLRTLMEKNFVRIVSRRDEIGKPIEYGTTQKFLDYFGLNTLNDLPDEEEIGAVLGEG